MNQADEHTFKRATTAAVLGLVAQIILLIVMGLLGVYAESRAIHAATWHLVGGLPVWIILWMLYNQYRLERLESLETAALAKDAVASEIFAEADQQLALARRRLDKLIKFGLPIVSVLMSIFYIAMGAMLLHMIMQLRAQGMLAQQAIGAEVNFGLVSLILIAELFVTFLLGRYIAGMTQVKEWQALRAGAACLMGNVVVMIVIVAAAIYAYFNNNTGFIVAAYAIPVFMILLGIEIILALFLGLYRPRRADEFVRPAFDSRLTGWLARPESIGKIVSDTINYQFGFEISQSWFYRLLFRSAMPLVLTAIVLILLMTCIVIVEPQENVVITRFGQFVRIAEPGLRLKMPWPIGGARPYNVHLVQQLIIGSATGVKPGSAVLWTNPHGEGEEKYIVTAPTLAADTVTSTGAAAGNRAVVAGELIGATVYIKYRIANLDQYIHSAQEPERVLGAVAEQQISAYFATRSVDALLGVGRTAASDDLRKSITNAVNARQLGLEIVFVSVSGVHPPQASEVADKFHEVIGALQEKQTKIEGGKKDAVTMLAAVAGSREKALQISDAIEQLSALRRQFEVSAGGINEPAQQKLDEKTVEIERLLDNAGGQAAQEIFGARAYRWDRAITELAKTERFASELEAYRQAPLYYRTKQYLDTLAEGLRDRRKIILDTDKAGVDPTIRLQMLDKRSALSEMLNKE